MVVADGGAGGGGGSFGGMEVATRMNVEVPSPRFLLPAKSVSRAVGGGEAPEESF